MKLIVENNVLAGSLSLPIDGLSQGTQEIIRGYADGYQCNRDFITATVFITVSATIGKKVCVYDGRYKNYLPFFTCLVAPSGSNKTTPMREVLRPLINRNSLNYDSFQKEMKKYASSVKEGNEDEPKPVFRQLIISDSTPESRIKALSENPNVLLVSDEIATMLYNVNRYNKSGEIPQLISIWSVDDIVNNRKTESPVLIKEPYLSIIGGTQPDILANIFGSDYFMNSGFNQRWLFVYPDSVPPAMYSENRVPKEIFEAWNRYINELLDFDFENSGFNALYIKDEAKRLYIEYYNRLQSKKAVAGEYMAAVYAKLQIIIERWAGVTHILGDKWDSTDILPEEMEYSIRCMDYFERCAEKVYMKLTENKKQAETKQLTKEQLIAMCYNSCNPKSKQSFADAIGVSRQMVSRAVKKYPLLRCCGCGNDLDIDNEENIDKIGVTA
ncbi:DUF3987 domain-containing protein [Coprobacter secundus]|uniref:DUF3987 domain-containing protein n=1 Tax=Coprobacter secundus subsp. similis TaxID=2751153 RepID=A0A7G1HYU1_9BACT|nr:DUF3987 domain-containing protein [Coprobacter secundus]BCI64879.1 hypothetical protein Cop2CBH44_32320 [Coprobacter secundus subsp. similis]